MANLKVALELIARDSASAKISKVLKDIAQESKQAEQSVKGLNGEAGKLNSVNASGASRSLKEIAQGAQVGSKAFQSLIAEGRQLSSMPKPRMIEDLKLVERAANAAKRAYSGLATVARAGVAVAKGGFQAGLGVAAGAAVAAQPVKRTMEYDKRLAYMSNTAYSDRDLAGRKAGMRELGEAVKRAVRVGGGSRDSAADALDAMIASGGMGKNNAESIKNSIEALPTITKFATASGADPTELANIAVRGMQSFGIKSAELPKALDMAMAAGQAGGFEIKDMAKWLPQQMAAARMSGLSGLAGFGSLLAANQASVITAGTKDEAGNNLVNLLAKINSKDTANDFKKLHIDLPGSLAAKRGKGMDSLDAFVSFADDIANRDKNYTALRQNTKAASGSDRIAMLNSQADILQGSAVGQIIQDRQALMSLVALMNNREYVEDVKKTIGKSAGTGDNAHQLIADTPSFKADQLGAEKQFAEQEGFKKIDESLGKTAEWLTDLARKYPDLASGMSLATEAVKTFAATLAGIGIGGLLTGGVIGSKALAATAAAETATAGVGSVSAATGAAVAAPAAAAGLGSMSLSGIAGMGAGAIGLAALGVGSAGVAGYAGGKILSAGIDKLISAISGREETLGTAIYALMNKEIPVKVDATVRVENGNITAQIEQAVARQAHRF